jgi:sec-independent protein translocase protein TatA
MFSGWERPSHWLVLAIVVIVLFGYKKLPDMSRSVGRSLRIFKTEMKGLNDDDAARDSAEQPVAPPAAPVAPVQPAVPVNPPAATTQSAQTAPVSASTPTPVTPAAAPSAENSVPSPTQNNS